MRPFTNRTRLLLGCALAVATVLVLVWQFSRHRQPEYQGIRLNQWLEAYNRAAGLSSSNGPVDLEPIAKAVRAMGTNSLPFLLKHILHRDSVIAENLYNLAARQHVFKPPVHHDYPYYAPSIMALMALGPDARSILPELSKAALTSSEHALFAMLVFGTNAIPALELVCLSPNRETRSQAGMYIAALKSAGAKSLLRWDWSQDPGGGPLLNIHDKRPVDYGVELVNLLQSQNAAVRLASADAIAFHPMMRMPVQSAMSLLKERLNDPDPEVRKSAANALKELNTAGPWPGIPKTASTQATGQTNFVSQAAP